MGRLFRSSVDQHLKRNLVIFVSARLLSTGGEPIHGSDEQEELVELLGPRRLPEYAPAPRRSD